ncbi:unnamed protein product [Mytilus coruscus]|uniref:Integrase catalytic domain-containing protein n=1 Tax=Mytilus coruscus TaxID=42192 RepID=A0A6J8D869_MYTCO|nr:unnamed protein product [Mytilus coruscus]
MIVQGRILQGIHHKVTGLIEPAGPFLSDNGCLIPKAMVNPRMKYLSVRIINLSEQPVQLYRKAIIGQCKLIDSDIIEINELSRQLYAREKLYQIRNQKEVLPEYLQNLYERSITHLDKEQVKVFNLLLKYQTTFSKSKSDLGRTAIVKHKIDTGGAPPFKMQPRCLPMSNREVASKEIKRLLDDGIIESSNGQYASPIVLVTKPDQSTRLCIDYRKIKQSRQGNKFILIVSEYFTRWIETYPIPQIQAPTICRVFIAEFVSLYGIPRQIYTDCGAQFTSQLFKEICDAFHIAKTYTTAFYPKSDGLVERFNRTVEDMLSKVVSRDQKNWDDILPMVKLAYRTSEHESTGQSPSMMMFGREAELPIDLLLGLPPAIT